MKVIVFFAPTCYQSVKEIFSQVSKRIVITTALNLHYIDSWSSYEQNKLDDWTDEKFNFFISTCIIHLNSSLRNGKILVS